MNYLNRLISEVDEAEGEFLIAKEMYMKAMFERNNVHRNVIHKLAENKDYDYLKLDVAKLRRTARHL